MPALPQVHQARPVLARVDHQEHPAAERVGTRLEAEHPTHPRVATPEQQALQECRPDQPADLLGVEHQEHP
jgi:hypothetical protein